MGLGAFKNAWQRQTKDFGHDQALRYSCLILDNRGMGESDKPLNRYSTSDMARDTLEVVDYLGWTEKRQLHVIGVSMGGMIAQEMVKRLNSWSKTLIIDEELGDVCSRKDRIIIPCVDSSAFGQYGRIRRKSEIPY